MNSVLLGHAHKIGEVLGYGHESDEVQMLTWKIREEQGWSYESYDSYDSYYSYESYDSYETYESYESYESYDL